MRLPSVAPRLHAIPDERGGHHGDSQRDRRRERGAFAQRLRRQLSGTHAARIGTTPGAAYVWGIDRGAGTELLTELDPPAGEGVTFDAVVILLPDVTGSFIDLAGGGAPQPLDPSSVDISGRTISVSLPRSLLPSQGLDFADYRYNLWPRFAPGGVDPGDNTQISDFAPDASTFVAQPQEPEEVDWNALAAQVQANFAATGTWYL